MFLSSALADPEAATRYMERYVNKRKPGSHSSWSDVPERYSPEGGLDFFALPEFSVPLELVCILRESPTLLVERQHITRDKVYFPVHPAMLADPAYLAMTGLANLKRADRRIRVTPTSSTRTLWPLANRSMYLVKTDLDKRHYRFHRRLKRSSVAHSLAISRTLESESKSLAEGEIAFLAESIGMIVGGEEDQTSAGAIVREATPRPVVDRSRLLIPLFSIYGVDEKNPSHPSILLQLLEANASPHLFTHWFTHQLLGRIIKSWTHLVKKHGMLHEIHGQNALLEVDSELRPTRLVIRDLQGVYLDQEIRSSLGLSMPSWKHVVGEEAGTTSESQFSHSYDHMVGDYLLTRLTDSFLTLFPTTSRQSIVNDAREIFRQAFPEHRAHFPVEAYGFGLQGLNNEVMLIPKAHHATWR